MIAVSFAMIFKNRPKDTAIIHFSFFIIYFSVFRIRYSVISAGTGVYGGFGSV